MNKLKELWQYPVFRWCVYQIPLLVFGYIMQVGTLYDDIGIRNYGTGANIIWVFILTLPALRVWRKPIWKLLKQALSFLNKKAEEE